MKLLIQVNGTSEYAEISTNYAIVDLTEEAKVYLATRKAGFSAMKNLTDDLVEMRFYNFEFITFYKSIDLSAVMDEDEHQLFDEQGYWEVDDDFETDAEEVDVELEQLVLDDETWYVSANEKHGSEIATREVPFHSPRPATLSEIVEQAR